jgi:hypothetical protein
MRTDYPPLKSNCMKYCAPSKFMIQADSYSYSYMWLHMAVIISQYLVFASINTIARLTVYASTVAISIHIFSLSVFPSIFFLVPCQIFDQWPPSLHLRLGWPPLPSASCWCFHPWWSHVMISQHVSPNVYPRVCHSRKGRARAFATPSL